MHRKLIVIFLLVLMSLGVIIYKLNLSRQAEKLQVKVAGVKTSTVKIPTIAPSFTPIPTASPSPTLTPSPTATPSPTLVPVIILPEDLDKLFTKYCDEYSVDKELLKRIAKCESGLNPNAGSNKYAGLFQFAEPIWIQTRTLLGQNPDTSLRFNAEEAIKTAAFMISQGHFGIWPNCGK